MQADHTAHTDYRLTTCQPKQRIMLSWRTTRTRIKRWSTYQSGRDWFVILLSCLSFLLWWYKQQIDKFYVSCFLHFATWCMTGQTSQISHIAQLHKSIYSYLCTNTMCENASSKNHGSQTIPLMHAHVSCLKMEIKVLYDLN